jgi:hypothetical protein
MPLGIRFAMLAVGAVMFFGSWFVGNTVDGSTAPSADRKMLMLQKDALTFFLRIIGAFVFIAALLTWVISGGKHIAL